MSIIDKRIELLSAQIKELEAQRDREIETRRYQQVTTDTQRLAIQLHSLQCRWNHTDECSWYYSVKCAPGSNSDAADALHDWNGYTHAEYLKKAQTLAKFCDERGISMVDAIQLIQLSK